MHSKGEASKDLPATVKWLGRREADRLLGVLLTEPLDAESTQALDGRVYALAGTAALVRSVVSGLVPRGLEMLVLRGALATDLAALAEAERSRADRPARVPLATLRGVRVVRRSHPVGWLPVAHEARGASTPERCAWWLLDHEHRGHDAPPFDGPRGFDATVDAVGRPPFATMASWAHACARARASDFPDLPDPFTPARTIADLGLSILGLDAHDGLLLALRTS